MNDPKMIDYRSDTVTQPTPQMIEAMSKAPVGDDVYGEDPTIKELEQYAADLFGMENALFCPSGTMTNQIAIKAHTTPGKEVICHEWAHIYNYEGGGVAFNSGCQIRPIPSKDGKFKALDVEARIQSNADVHAAPTALISVENTVNKAGGTVWKKDEIEPITRVGQIHNIPLHLDGARLFNALEATGETPADYGKLFNSISICLSKGLGAPVGSLLLGSDQFITKARRIRKVMGGGMRQAGIIAAGGLYALKNNIDRLSEDRENAIKIYEAVKESAIWKSVEKPQTNIVLFEPTDNKPLNAVLTEMEKYGIKASPMGSKIRMVTHLNHSHEDIVRTCDILRSL